MAYGDGITGQDWTKDFSNNLLIYGGPKEGKTTVATPFIKEALDEDPNALCYVINTDKGFTKPALHAGLDDPKYKDRIKYFYVNTIKRAIDVMDVVKKEVQQRANPNDVVLFDLLSWSWDEAQKEFVNEISGGEVVGFLAKAMQDDKRFGAFEGLQWGYIKKAEDMVSNSLSRNPICKVIALARVKDVKVGYKLARKKQDIWYDLGIPDTRKDIAHEFATIVKIEKFTHEGKTMRRFMVVGARDFDPDYKWHAYDTPENFRDQLTALLGGEVLGGGTPVEQEEEGLTEEDTKELVDCIRKNFSDKVFTLGDVLDMCGQEYAEAIDEILEEGVKLGKVFKVGDGIFSFIEPVEKAAPPPPKVKPKKDVAKPEISTSMLMREISKLDEGKGANVEALVKKLENLYPKDDVIGGLEVLLEKGQVFEPEAGVVKLVGEQVYESKAPEEPVKVEEKDDGW